MNVIKTPLKNIYFNHRPFSEKDVLSYISFCIKNNIKTIIVLLTYQEFFYFYKFNLLQMYKDANLKVIHFPIEDYDIPKDITKYNLFIKDTIKELKSTNILIHCAGGIGRTGLVIVSILMKLLKKNVFEILNYIRTKFFIVETKEQEEFLVKYYNIFIK